jgi:tryptophan-rich sensory protein
MVNILNGEKITSLLRNVILIVGLIITANVIVFTLGWDKEGANQIEAEFAPPGYVVGVVWVGLFVLMAVARWLIVESRGIDAAAHARLITILAVLCFLYPFYTFGLSSRTMGLIGNCIIILLAGWTIWQVKSSSKTAGALLSAVVLWVSFASVIIIRELQLNA